MAAESKEVRKQHPNMNRHDLADVLLRLWPRLAVLSPPEMDWLLDAFDLLSDAGASGLVARIVGGPNREPLADSEQNRPSLLDLLAEVRTGADLARHGFRLEYEALGDCPKTVDFLASALELQVWVEVKRLRAGQQEMEC
jgi:hypothetical protein